MTGVDGERNRVKTSRYGIGLRYRVRYIAPDGRERSESFPDRAKREADAFLASVETDKHRGAFIDPAAGRKPFQPFAEDWLRTHRLDESTREGVEIRVRKHIIPFFGSRPIGSIKPSTVREWETGLVGVLAPSTRAVAFAYLRSILTAAVDDGLIAKNPCSAKSVSKPQPTAGKVIPWKPAEVLTIRDAVPRRYQAMVEVGAGCGLRQGEIFGLSPEDLDTEGGWLTVRRQVKRVRGRLVFGLPKSDLERKVPLPSSVADALGHHVAKCPPVTVTLPWEEPQYGEPTTVRLVFTSARGNALTRQTFNNDVWRPALIRAGLVPSRRTGMHALRHFYASVLLDAGESIKALAEWLGHANPAFTLRVYTHLMVTSQGRAQRAVDEVLGAAQGTSTPPSSDGPTTAQGRI